MNKMVRDVFLNAGFMLFLCIMAIIIIFLFIDGLATFATNFAHGML